MSVENRTPSVTELLESYKKSIGEGGEVNTALLIQALRNRQARAEEKDAATAKNIQSVGKLGLNVLKARKDFLLAKRTNPELTFSEFILKPENSAKYMLEGVESISSGKKPEIGIKEIFNPFSKEYSRNLNAEKSQEMLEQARREAVQKMPSSQVDMLPDQSFSAEPELKDFSSLPTAPPVAPMGNVAGQGLNDMLNRGKTPFIPSVTRQYVSPEKVAEMTKVNPIQMEPVNARPRLINPLENIRKGNQNLLEGVEKVPVSDPLSQASSSGGTLGTAFNALQLGMGAYNTSKATNTEDRQSAIGDTALSAVGMAVPPVNAFKTLLDLTKNIRMNRRNSYG